jgi:glucose/arabinose dehydrogenase
MVVILLFVGCSSNNQQGSINNEKYAENEQGNEELEVIAGVLNVPWLLDKYDNTFFLTARAGTILKIENGEVERQSVELEKVLSTVSEGGLMGFVLARDFQESNLAYAYYSTKTARDSFNRVVTLRLEDNGWREESLLIDKIPGNSCIMEEDLILDMTENFMQQLVMHMIGVYLKTLLH